METAKIGSRFPGTELLAFQFLHVRVRLPMASSRVYPGGRATTRTATVQGHTYSFIAAAILGSGVSYGLSPCDDGNMSKRVGPSDVPGAAASTWNRDDPAMGQTALQGKEGAGKKSPLAQRAYSDDSLAETVDSAPRTAAGEGEHSGILGDAFGSISEDKNGPSSSQPGQFPVENWDRYELLSLLGRGGMGAVYKAMDRRIRRLVAVKFVRGDDEKLLRRFLQEARAQAVFSACIQVNKQFQQCYLNQGELQVQAAFRLLAVDSQQATHLAAKGQQHLAQARQLGGAWLDLEQFTALAHLVEAEGAVQQKQNPAPHLAQLHKAVDRCLRLGKTDAMCLTIGARAFWTEASWQIQSGHSPMQSLQKGLQAAQRAYDSPESYPDAGQTLAETHRRLAEWSVGAERKKQLDAAERALKKSLSINPRHAQSLLTQGGVWLLKGGEYVAKAQSVLERAVAVDPMLKRQKEKLLAQTPVGKAG